MCRQSGAAASRATTTRIRCLNFVVHRMPALKLHCKAMDLLLPATRCIAHCWTATRLRRYFSLAFGRRAFFAGPPAAPKSRRQNVIFSTSVKHCMAVTGLVYVAAMDPENLRGGVELPRACARAERPGPRSSPPWQSTRPQRAANSNSITVCLFRPIIARGGWVWRCARCSEVGA
jgi:hypothetical protein